MPTLSRRWFQFRLRTLLIAVAVLAVPMAWAGYSLSWIRERRKATLRDVFLEPNCWIHVGPDDDAVAPSGLWIFGEGGYKLLVSGKAPGERERLAALFPEAKVMSDEEYMKQFEVRQPGEGSRE